MWAEIEIRAASMGPRLVSRGDGIGGEKPRAAIQASMGPRLVSRGDGNERVGGIPNSLASMGPRLVSRGDQVGQKNQTNPRELQWGRGL